MRLAFQNHQGCDATVFSVWMFLVVEEYTLWRVTVSAILLWGASAVELAWTAVRLS